MVPDRIAGGPEWIDSDRFQIAARASEPAGQSVLDAMLQTLLAERFRLKLRREIRKRDAFVLELAKKGPKLEPSTKPPGSYRNLHGRMEAASVTMGQFTDALSRELGTPVIDRTGLSGAFNFTLVWNPDSPRTFELGTGAASDADGELFYAIRQQLGLTLKERRMPIEVLVIDHAEKPSPD